MLKGKIEFNSKLVLLVILVLGLVVRVYRLNEVPFGFFCDEASRGVEAYSLLNSGVDSYGKSWPLFFQALDAPIPGLQFYSVIPFVKIFGLTEIAVRFASVFWGLVGILGIYMLGGEIERNCHKIFANKVRTKLKFKLFLKYIKLENIKLKHIGIWSAFVMAIEPWGVHYSRTGFEYLVYMVMYVWGFWVWFKAKKNPNWWFGFGLIWGIALYTYNGAYITVPVTVILLSLLVLPELFRRNRWRYLIIALGLFITMTIPVLKHLMFEGGLTRWNQVAGQGISWDLRVDKIISQYQHQFSYDFFWGQGEDTFITRHFTGGLLPLLEVQTPLILVGLIWVLLKIRMMGWVLIWLAVYPVVGALADGGPFTGRSVIGAPLAALLTGLGIAVVVNIAAKLGSRVKFCVSVVILLMFLVSFSGFWKFYMNDYPLYSADFWGWQYGPKEIVSYFETVDNKYDDLLMSGEFNAPHIFIPFYAPEGCNGCSVGGIESYNPRRKQLFAMSPGSVQKMFSLGWVMNVQKEITYPNGEVAFFIGELERQKVEFGCGY